MKALGRSTSRDRRCAPRPCGACGVGERPRRPRPLESTRTVDGRPTGVVGG